MALEAPTTNFVRSSELCDEGRRFMPFQPEHCSSRGADSSEGLPKTWKGGDLPYLYEVWPDTSAQSRFVFRGRCLAGPEVDLWYHGSAWAFILVPSAFYFACPARVLWEEGHQGLPVATAVLLVLDLALMLMTGHTDPGFIPRASLQLAVPGLEQRTAAVVGTPNVVFDDNTGEILCSLSVEHLKDGFRWCGTCKVARPPKASHCSDCNSCVLRYDHHCPFVNNCIGKRNYAFFCGFVITTACLGLSVMWGVWHWYWHSAAGEKLRATERSITHAGLLIFSSLTLVCLFGVLALLCFHSFLVFFGCTTKEAFAARKKAREGDGALTLGSSTDALTSGFAAAAAAARAGSMLALGSDSPAKDSGPYTAEGRELTRRKSPRFERGPSLIPARQRVDHYPFKVF